MGRRGMLVPIDLILVIAMDDFALRVDDKGDVKVAVGVELGISSPTLAGNEGPVLLRLLAKPVQFRTGELVEPFVCGNGMVKAQPGIGKGLNGRLPQSDQLDRILQSRQPDGCIIASQMVSMFLSQSCGV